MLQDKWRNFMNLEYLSYPKFVCVNIKPDESSKLETHYIFSIPLFQDAELGSNLVKLPTSATAVKEKDGSIYCQPEILCEGKKYLLYRSQMHSLTHLHLVVF